MNKKTLILNGIWLLVAVAAFALGRYDASSPTAENERGKKFASGASKYAEAGSSDAKSSGKDGAKKAGGSDDPSLEALRIPGPPSAKDMRQLVLDALNEPNPLKSNLLFAQLLEQLTVDNAEAAMDALRENADGQTMFRQMGLLTYAYGALDGEAAIAYAQGIEGRGAVFTTSSALSGWASANPQAAMEWLKSQEGLEGMEKAMFARGLVNGLAQTNLKLATEYALSVTDPEMQRQFFDVIAGEQMKAGIESASAWVGTLPEDAKSNALERLARELTRNDLDAAAEWAPKYANEPFGARAVAEVADELAEIDPNRALVFVDGLPAGDAKNRAMMATFQELTRSDFESANNLINEMAAGPMRDYATLAFIDQARRDDPQGALALTTTIDDAAVREKAQINALQPIYRLDPASALQQAANLGVSQEGQQQLIESAERRDYGGPGGGDYRGPRPDFGGFGGRGPGGR